VKALKWLVATGGFGLAVALFLAQVPVPGRMPVRSGPVMGGAQAPEHQELAVAAERESAAGRQLASAAQRRAYERELFAQVRAIPAAYFEENRDGYARLLELDPQNDYYRKKFEYYSNRLAARQQRFREGVREVLARTGAESEVLIEELVDQGVVEKTGVPGAIPRLWVATNFYALDFETQQQVVEVFYRHYRAQDPGYDTVVVYDDGSGEMVGIYGEVHGGLSLY